MAVINCPKCGKMMSSMLDVCPECGYNRNQQKGEAECVGGGTGENDLTQTNADAPKKSSSSKKWIITMVILIILLVIGAVVGVLYRNTLMEQRAFDALQGSSNMQLYENYMVKYPDGRHIEEVKRLYAVVKQEYEQFYNEVYDAGRKALVDYMNENPESPYIRICEQRLDSIDWKEAKTENTVEAYEKYLAIHQDGMFVDDALEAKITAARMQISYEDRNLVRGAVENFLLAMASGDPQRVDALMSDKFVFGSQTNVNGQVVIDFYMQQFNQPDIIGVHFDVPDTLHITKKDTEMPGQYDFNVKAPIKAMVSRISVDSTTVQTLNMEANISPDRHFKSFSLKK